MKKRLLTVLLSSAALWSVFGFPGALSRAYAFPGAQQRPLTASGSDSLGAAASAAPTGADSLRSDSLSVDSLSVDSLSVDSLSADSLLDLRSAADSLVLSARELDSLEQLSQTHWIDTVIMATPKDVPSRRPREWDVKWNMIMGAFATPFFGFSFSVADQWTLEFDGSYNAWSLKNERHWKHGQGSAGARFWTKDREQGHFVGAHVLGGVYNFNGVRLPYQSYPSMDDHRYEGWGVGGGFSYGYRWNFSERWAMEGELGVGYVYSKYDKFACDRCGEKIASGKHHYVGPTKLALNLIYRFGKKSREAYKRAIAPRPTPLIRERLVRDTVTMTETQIQIQRDTLVQRDTVQLEAPTPVVSNLDYTLHIEYKTGSSMYQSALGNNDEEMQKFLHVLDTLRSNKNITLNSIQVIGYASIDGATDTNQRLSNQRAQSVAAYLRSKYPDMSRLISSEGRGEDWDGLLKHIEESIGLEGKDEAAYIIRTVGINSGREGQLMRLNGGRFYRAISQELFPKLRRIECKIGFTEIKMQKKGTATVSTQEE